MPIACTPWPGKQKTRRAFSKGLSFWISSDAASCGKAAASAARHDASQAPPSDPPAGPSAGPTASTTARQKASGSAGTTVDTARSGSTHRQQGSTASTSAPSAARAASHCPSGLDTHGAPRWTTTSGARADRTMGTRASRSAPPMTTGSSVRAPDRGSASRGHPRAEASATTAAGSPQPAPATSTPRAPRRAVSATAATAPAGAAPGSRTTLCQGPPSDLPGSVPDTAPSNGSRKARLRWTGPGPCGPATASATDRAANERHVPRDPASAGPGSANHRTDRP